MITTFENSLTWQKSSKLAVDIYRSLSSSKDWGFKDQIQRAVVSISNNIAEGFERKSKKEFRQFLVIAKGSCGEVRSMLYIAKEIGYIDEKQFNLFQIQCLEISRMLSGFIKSIG